MTRMSTLGASCCVLAVLHLQAVQVSAQQQTWQIVDTENFRIYHRDLALADEVAVLAEEARTEALRTWLSGVVSPAWNPRCDLYLYRSADDYDRAALLPAKSPGYSHVVNNGGRILRRKIVLRTADAEFKHTVLPHEVTHVALAGEFGSHRLPIWADEGIAVLSEPAASRQEQLRRLASRDAADSNLSCSRLFSLTRLPPARMPEFYAHSTGVCQYLIELEGRRAFLHFLRTSLNSGDYDTGLRTVYGIRDVRTLELKFRQFVTQLRLQEPHDLLSASHDSLNDGRQ